MSGTDAAAGDPGTELATIEAQVGTPAYWRNEGGIQDRYLDLLGQREIGAAPPARQDVAPARPPPARRLSHKEVAAETDTLMATEAAAAEAWRKSPGQARRDLPAQLVREWDEAGDGFEVRLRRAQDTLMAVAQAIGNKDTAAFQASIEELPENIRVAINREAAELTPGYVRPLDGAELAQFRSRDGGAGAVLATMWGNKAARRAAVARARFRRCRDSLSAGDQPAFIQWWEHRLSVLERAAVFLVLGLAD